MPTNTVEYLVLDIDNCALRLHKKIVGEEIIPNPRQDLLSSQVIDEGRKGHYAGFYICTRRSIYTTFKATLDDSRLENCKKLKRDFEPKNQFITFVVQNLEKAMGIPCIAVSTLDDLGRTTSLASQCGYGYRNMINPLEKKLIEINQDLFDKQAYSGYCNSVFLDEDNDRYAESKGYFQAETKNPQLIQIANHAAARNTNKKIKLSFWDDEKPLCEAASKMKAESLPEAVSLNITHYDAFDNSLNHIGSVGKSNLLKYSLFAATAVTVAAVVVCVHACRNVLSQSYGRP